MQNRHQIRELREYHFLPTSFHKLPLLGRKSQQTCWMCKELLLRPYSMLFDYKIGGRKNMLEGWNNWYNWYFKQSRPEQEENRLETWENDNTTENRATITTSLSMADIVNNPFSFPFLEVNQTIQLLTPKGFGKVCKLQSYSFSYQL